MLDINFIIKNKRIFISLIPFTVCMIVYLILHKIFKNNKITKFLFFSILFLNVFYFNKDIEILNMENNHYRTYKVDRYYKNSQIRSSLRKFTAMNHPDKPNSKKEEYLNVTAVQEILLNKNKRVMYDYYNLDFDKINNIPITEIKDVERSYMKFSILEVGSENFVWFIISIIMVIILKDYDSGNVATKLILIKMGIKGYLYALHRVDTFCITDFLFPYSSFYEQQTKLDFLFSFILAIGYIHYMVFSQNEKKNIKEVLEKLKQNSKSKESKVYKDCVLEFEEIIKLTN